MKTIASLATVALACLGMAGCATSSKDVPVTYVSPLQYQSYDCTQISQENQRLGARVTELGGRLDQAAVHDQQIAGVGAILFWPALFALGGTKAQEAEYGRIKGEHDALQQTAIAKKCGPAATSLVAVAQPVPAAATPATPAAPDFAATAVTTAPNNGSSVSSGGHPGTAGTQ